MKDEQNDTKVTKPVTFEDIMLEVNRLLVTNPRALEVGLFKTEGQNNHYYSYGDKTQRGYEIRKQAKELLSKLWQSGAYNYTEFADALRVKVLDVMGLLDEEFIRKNLR